MEFEDKKLVLQPMEDGPFGPIGDIKANASISGNYLDAHWSARNFGFGGFTLRYDQMRGRLQCNSENMSKEFVARALVAMINDNTDFEWETEKKKVVYLITLAEINADMRLPQDMGKQKCGYIHFPHHTKTYPRQKITRCLFKIKEDNILALWIKHPDEEDVFDAVMRIHDTRFTDIDIVRAERWKWE